MSATRDRIADHVAANPGVHFSGVVRALDLARGQVQYHLRRLDSEGDLVAEEWWGRTHYYPPEYDAWDRRTLALLRRETAADIVAVLLARGATSPAAVADELGLAHSTVAYHVDRLVDSGVVDRRRGDGRVRLTVARPADTAELLTVADQPATERLVGRFVRLVDRLLADV